MIINEMTRPELIKKSKTKTSWNRYNRRMQVTKDQIKFTQVGIGQFLMDSPNLDLYFRVRTYLVKIRLMNFVTRVKILLNQGKYNGNLKKIVEAALKSTLNKNDIKVSCSCPDFYYRFSYKATMMEYGFDTNQYIPARIRNPHMEGSMCKHLVRLLNAPSLWIPKVTVLVTRMMTGTPQIFDNLGVDVK